MLKGCRLRRKCNDERQTSEVTTGNMFCDIFEQVIVSTTRYIDIGPQFSPPSSLSVVTSALGLMCLARPISSYGDRFSIPDFRRPGFRRCHRPNKFEKFEERCHRIEFTESLSHLRPITGHFFFCQKNYFLKYFKYSLLALRLIKKEGDGGGSGGVE